MATKKYGYNQYKPDGPAGMDVVDAELNRYSPAFDYLSGFVTRSKLKQVDDDRTGTSTGGGSTGGGSTGGGSSTITNQFNPTVNVTGGTQTQQTQAAGGDIVDSGQTNTASTTSTTTGSTNTVDTTTGSTNNNNNNDDDNTVQTCPAGKVGTPPNCTDPVADTCPTGKVGTPPNCTDPVVSDFGSGFATEADAKNYISDYYQEKLGRAAKFGTTTDDTDASYWLNNLMKGSTSGETKESFMSNVLLSDEYTKPTSESGGFLQDYSKKIAADDSTNTTNLSAGVTKDATTGVYDTSNLTTAEAEKFNAMSAGVQDTYAQDLDVADLTATTTQTSDHIDSGAAKTSTIDQAIKDAYKLLNRSPDKGGYEYWAKELTKNPGFDLSKSFKLSDEYKNLNT